MPTAKKAEVSRPETLAPYEFHGVKFNWREGKTNATADCPKCGHDGDKWAMKVENGTFNCFSCQWAGNVLTFLRWLAEESDRRTKVEDYKALAEDRRLLNPDTLMAWGVCRSVLSGDWLVPAHDPQGRLSNLYRYSKDRRTGERILKGTSGQHAAVMGFGPGLWDASKAEAAVCEGPWDAMALWEAMRSAKEDSEGELSLTGNPDASLLAKWNVVGVPGAGVFQETWCPPFAGKRVAILFDNDHPRTVDGQERGLAGFKGTQRTARILAGAGGDGSPETIRYLKWGIDGFDPDFEDGFDLRDCLGDRDRGNRIDALKFLLDKIEPIPADWVPGRTAGAKKSGGTEIEILPCREWRVLENQWRKAMHWPSDGLGLSGALAVSLAVAASMRMNDDQVWMRIISPPSTGKTSVVDSLAVSRRYVKSIGNFTGLHSGFQTDREGESDHSLLAMIKDKTLIVKDGDTLMSNPAREKIMGQLRDAYDTNCGTAYGNAVKREYVGHRFTILLLGTERLMEMDVAANGARFLDYVIMYGIDPALESSVNRRGFHRILRNRGVEANGVLETHSDKEFVRAKQLTGGYLEFLRENASELLASVRDDNADELEPWFDAAAQFVAFMRARPASAKKAEAETREMSARVHNQMTKLALCLAAVLNRPRIDAPVLRIVRKVALDTSRGRTYDLVRRIRSYEVENGGEGAFSGALAAQTGHPTAEEGGFLRFLQRIKACDPYKKTSAGQHRWRLTARLRALYDAVHEEIT